MEKVNGRYVINIDDIQAVDSMLASAPPKPKSDSLRISEAIELLKPRIVVLNESGYNADEISRMIESGGLGAPVTAIRAHVVKLLKAASASKQSRRM